MYKKTCIEDRINSFVLCSFFLSSYISRPINLQYTKITSSVENYSFFVVFFSLSSIASTSSQTIILSCVCVTQKQLLNIASIHDSSVYKSLRCHHLRSQEKLIDDDVKSDISNSIKLEARMSVFEEKEERKSFR